VALEATTVRAGPGLRRAPALSGAMSQLAAFISLTKPRIIELLLVTTLPTMVVAAHGWPPVRAVLVTLAGGTLSAGGANAANMYLERDLDAMMRRTAHRPLVTGVVSPRAALLFATSLEVVAFFSLWLGANFLSASLALAAALFYVFVYTALLKRSSPQNIVIGGAAGAVPVLVGWAAVRGSLSWPPLLLFALVFLWTPPHFWALAIRYRDDYAKANVPMLPVVRSPTRTSAEITAYTFATLAASFAFGAVAGMHWLYWLMAIAAGAVFAALSLRLLRSPGPVLAMRVFHWSITYLSVVFVAMAVDVALR